jgi:hypothetical protein
VGRLPTQLCKLPQRTIYPPWSGYTVIGLALDHVIESRASNLKFLIAGKSVGRIIRIMEPPPTPIESVRLPTPSIGTRPSIEETERATTREFTWSLTPTPAPRSRETTAVPVPATPTPAPATTTGTRARIRKLTPADHLILMTHVCARQDEYLTGKIAFWKTISMLFQEDTGRFNSYLFILLGTLN